MMERRIEIDGERWDDVAEEGKMRPGIAGKLGCRTIRVPRFPD